MNKSSQNPPIAQRLSRCFHQTVLFSPLLISVLIMLPRLISPQFGLFDDGNMLRSAQQMSHGDLNLAWDTSAGRSRLIYRLFFGAQYFLFAKNPEGYFIVNMLVFALTTAGIISLVRLLKGSRLQAWSAGALFALAGPVIENYYTLSKGEGIQLLWLVLSLLLIVLFPRAKKLLWKASILAGCSVFLICAILSKETSLVVLPISLCWLFVALIRRRLRRPVPYISAYALYALANLIAAAGLLTARFFLGLHSLTGSGYGSGYVFTPGAILASTIRWGGWLIRDFSFLVPLIVLAVVQGLQERKFHWGELHINSTLWSAGWIAIYLPWMYTVEYYILPAVLGFALIAGLLLGKSLDFLRKPGESAFTIACLGFSGLLLLTSLANNLSNARIQLAVDEANTGMLDYITQNAPAGSLVLVNIQAPNEYSDEIAIQLNEVRQRPDILVETFAYQPASSLHRSVYLIAPESHNQPLLTVRMGVVEPTQNNWNASLQNYIAAHPGWGVSAIIEQKFGLTIIDLPRLLCPLIKSRAFCATPSPLVDLRPFTYGWTIYSIDLP
jgi:hypothetical protein